MPFVRLKAPYLGSFLVGRLGKRKVYDSARPNLMRNISQLAVSLVLLAAQANVSIHGTASAASDQSSTATSVLEVKLNTNTPDPVQVDGPKAPNFDTDVLAPLRADQAQEAAARAAAAAAATAQLAAANARKAAAARVASVSTTAVYVAGTDVWASLRACEAGGDYTRNSGNGYYGAYQYNLSTWANYDGYARPDLAPPAVQDTKAQATQAARGWSPWPACSRKLGLL